MQVWLRVKLFYAGYIKVFTFSREHVSAAYSLLFTERGVELLLSLCPSVHTLPVKTVNHCTWLKSDPALTGSTAKHVEILEFTGGSLKWLKFESK